MSEFKNTLDKCREFSPDIGQHYGRLLQAHNKELDSLKKQNEILRGAVEYYAQWNSPINKSDMRVIANEALAKIKELENQ